MLIDRPEDRVDVKTYLLSRFIELTESYPKHTVRSQTPIHLPREFSGSVSQNIRQIPVELGRC